MDFADSRIVLASTDTTLQDLLRAAPNNPGSFSRHFTQGEDFFISMAEPVTVPSLPIHHPVNQPKPAKEYRQGIQTLVSQLVQQVPQLFQGLTYFFDPRDHLRPSFYQLYRIAGQYYLYLLKIDLTFHPGRHHTLALGSNDASPEYRTKALILEADMIPISRIDNGTDGTKHLVVHQSVSDTWIGETGRGYFVQGIWLDRELTKFFSKLFLPRGKRTYPYYPFTCKYRSICLTVIHLDAQGRKGFLPLLHQARGYILDHLATIEDALRNQEFSENLPAFASLYEEIPDSLRRGFSTISMEAYLNDQEMREYEIIEKSL